MMQRLMQAIGVRSAGNQVRVRVRRARRQALVGRLVEAGIAWPADRWPRQMDRMRREADGGRGGSGSRGAPPSAINR